jgi:hypothetical protein
MRKIAALVALAAFGVCLLLAVLAEPKASPSSNGVVWSDDFERTDIRGTKWRAVEQPVTTHQAQTSTAHARDGLRSARFEVRDGDIFNGSDERQQLSGTLNPDGSPFEPKEGDDYYIALSLWFDAPFPRREGDASWQVFFALTSFDARGSGPLKIGHGGANGRLASEGVDQNDPAVGAGYYWMNDYPTSTGAWHDMILHVKFSRNASVGFIEFWHRAPGDAQYYLQTLTDGSTRRYFSTLLDAKAFVKLGVYRSHLFSAPSVMYADRLKFGTTYASVALP